MGKTVSLGVFFFAVARHQQNFHFALVMRTEAVLSQEHTQGSPGVGVESLWDSSALAKCDLNIRFILP